ncbi:MAG: hypothetical protein Q8P40_04755 [Nitrospirota bacterium]|nr:hypothetical protein [Nitrospirota bacterium]
MKGNNQDIRAKEIEIHLKEYEALHSEIELYTQRIDRYIGIYQVGLFAIIAVFLRPGADICLRKWLDGIHKDPYLTGLALLVPILNSLLQMYLLKCMLIILALARYTTYIIGGKLSSLVGADVLLWGKRLWDGKKEDIIKQTWLTTRRWVHRVYYVITSLLSFCILYWLGDHDIILLKRGVFLFLLYIGGVFSVLLSICYSIKYISVAKKFHEVQ